MSRDRSRYTEALHAMQSGVAAEIARGTSTDTTPKHLRVGVNAAMSDHAGLARLLIAKGVITEAEYLSAIADSMGEEADGYAKKLGVGLA